MSKWSSFTLADPKSLGCNDFLIYSFFQYRRPGLVYLSPIAMFLVWAPVPGILIGIASLLPLSIYLPGAVPGGWRLLLNQL